MISNLARKLAVIVVALAALAGCTFSARVLERTDVDRVEYGR